jgi:intraflagellar transport protein 88
MLFLDSGFSLAKDNEALTIYTQIVKNKQYPFSGRFRVNMGNIYFKQEKWTAAIKMYRMALAQIPNNVQAGFRRFPIS